HTRKIQIVLEDEQPEAGAQSGIYVNDLVPAIALVVEKIYVDQSTVAEFLHPAASDVIYRWVGATHSQSGVARIYRALPQFLSRKACNTFGILIEVSIEHPPAAFGVWNKFLQHEVGLRRIFEFIKAA